MTQRLINDLRVIYHQLEEAIFLRLIGHLDNIVKPNSKALWLKTRNENNNILFDRGQHYFSFFYKNQTKRVIVAGAMAYNSTNNLVPAIRFRNKNYALRFISESFRFPYRNSNWTYVEIRKETIDSFYSLLTTEIVYYLCHLTRRSS